MTSIDIRDLKLCRRAGFTLDVRQLNVGDGVRTALLGPSGCGKTTLLRCIAGLERFKGGEIRLGGRLANDPRSCIPPEARRIGFVFQDGALWPHMTALQHIRFARRGMARREAHARLEQVGISHLARRRPDSLSGGEAQRLALARALAAEPEILLLDEPLQSVDVHLRDELRLLIRRVSEERHLTTVLVTHDRDDALAVCDDLVVLRDGRIIETGTAGELVRAPKTAWTAAFLCGAACLPALPNGNGALDTVFGPVPNTGASKSPRLVVLPGDVSVVDHPIGPHTVVRVLQVVPAADGAIATVELNGYTLRVRCQSDVVAGSRVTLQLDSTPRILPAGEETLAS